MNTLSDWWLFLGRFHPVLVHLPIGLIVLLAFLEIMSAFPRFRNANSQTGLILALTVPFAIATAALGWLLSTEGGYNPKLLDLHKWTGVATAGCALLAALLYSLNCIVLYRAALFASLATLIVASHFGGSLTHGSGYLTQHAPPQLRALLKLPDKRAAKALPAKAPAGEAAESEDEPLFTAVIHPILDANCVSCHGPEKQKGSLRTDSFEALLEGGDSGPGIVAGKSGESEIIKRILLPLDSDEHMPPDGKPQPSADDIALLTWWIDSGADSRKGAIDSAPPAEIARILNLRRGNRALPAVPLPDAETSTLASAPATRSMTEIFPIVDRLTAELRIPITVLGQTESWVQCNASVAGRTFGDDQLETLTALGANLRWLDLAGTAVTDEGLRNLSAFPNLTKLHLQRTAITDEGLPHISSLAQLAYLNIYATKTTDKAFEHLRPLSNLKQIYAWQTAITPESAKVFVDSRIDKEQIARWEQEIEQLKAKIREQHVLVDLGIDLAEPVADAPKPINSKCPVSDEPVDPAKTVLHEGKLFAFCCDHCKSKFAADPKPFLTKIGLPATLSKAEEAPKSASSPSK